MRELFRKLQIVASLALGTLPAAMVLFTFLQPATVSRAWIYAGIYFVLALLGTQVPGKRRLLYGIVIAVAAAAATLLLADGKDLLSALIALLFYLVLFGWSLTIGSWQSSKELPALLRGICFGFHLLAQFVMIMERRELEPVLTSHAPELQCAFLVLIILTVLSLNRMSMNKASTVSQQVSLGMRRKNTGMTVVLLALAIGASFIPYIYDGVKALVLWVVRLLMRLLIFLPAEGRPGGAVSPESGSDSGLPMEEVAQSPLVQILEIVMLVLGVLLTVGIAVFLVYWIGRKLVGLTRHIWAAMERYAEAVSEDYQDEIIDTRREASAARIARERRSGIWRNDRKGPMSPGEAIRYRYRRLLRRHPEWTASTTARENIPLDWAKLYEQARYSDHAVTETDAERFQSGTKGL